MTGKTQEMASDALTKKYDSLIADCDSLIKSGQINSVSTLLSQVNLAQVPRVYRQPLAKICRRAGLFSSGLRLLQPLIRNEKAMQEPPSASEINEYAVLLSRNGSLQEALDLLNSLDVNQTSETLLYLGFCHILNWDYALAAQFLEKFLLTEADPYTKLIARVNLGASYVALGELEPAEKILLESIELAKAAGASRLVGNCLEMMGQVLIQREDFEKARSVLAEALPIFTQSQTYDQLLIYKWQTIATALENKSIDELVKFRAEAVKRSHWESVREADLFFVKVRFDQNLFDQVYYGTPKSGYRQRILQQIKAEPSASYLLGDSEGLVLDLATGHLNQPRELNPGKKIHQVISALTRDFYVPRNIGTLFAELYPDEYFDIDSSPLRVRQLLTRTRKWCDLNQISAEILQTEGTYRFNLHSGIGIRIPFERSQLDSQNLRWQRLNERFPEGAWFSVEQSCECLQISRSNFHRFVRWAVEQGRLESAGKAKATRHRVLRQSQPQNVLKKTG